MPKNYKRRYYSYIYKLGLNNKMLFRPLINDFRNSTDASREIAGTPFGLWLGLGNRVVGEVALIQILQDLYPLVEAVGNINAVILINADPLRNLESATSNIS